MKDGHAAVATVQDMVGVAAALSTGRASHQRVRQLGGRKGTKTVTDPFSLNKAEQIYFSGKRGLAQDSSPPGMEPLMELF